MPHKFKIGAIVYYRLKGRTLNAAAVLLGPQEKKPRPEAGLKVGVRHG
jgi:hypothetical protein